LTNRKKYATIFLVLSTEGENALTLEEEKYYDHYFTLFLSDGWKQFVDEIQEVHDGYRIEDIQTESNLSRVKGERAMLWKVIHFESSIRNAHTLIQEREADSNA